MFNTYISWQRFNFFLFCLYIYICYFSLYYFSPAFLPVKVYDNRMLVSYSSIISSHSGLKLRPLLNPLQGDHWIIFHQANEIGPGSIQSTNCLWWTLLTTGVVLTSRATWAGWECLDPLYPAVSAVRCWSVRYVYGIFRVQTTVRVPVNIGFSFKIKT